MSHVGCCEPRTAPTHLELRCLGRRRNIGFSLVKLARVLKHSVLPRKASSEGRTRCCPHSTWASTCHGKRFTAYVRRWLGVETERRSEHTERIRRLEALLRVNGIAPTDAKVKGEMGHA